MIRASTIEKEKLVLCRFHQLLRSDKDYTTDYMYEEAGKKAFLSIKKAGDIVRKHYRSIISEEMINFVHEKNKSNEMVNHYYAHKKSTRTELVNLFSEKFNVCIRESRLIIRFIWRVKR